MMPMKRMTRSARMIFCCLLLGSAAGACKTAPEGQASLPSPAGNTYTTTGNPILPVEAADPTLVRFGDRYYLFATGAGAAETGFAVWSSPDLQTWQNEGMALRFSELGWAEQNAWAPDVVERNGAYYLYFSADSRIGAATADRPEGPYRDALGKPLIPFSPDLSVIDPMVFIDDEGAAYLYWGAVPASWLDGKVDTIHTALWVRKLNPDLLSFDGPVVETVATSPRGPHIEGSYVIKRNGVYYLMWSEGNWNAADDKNAYRVKYARASSPMGPFLQPPDNTILASNRELGIIGPGHHSIIREPEADRYYIVYHAHSGIPDPKEGRPLRKIYIDRLHFEADGAIRPVVPTRAGVGSLPIRP